MKTRKCTIENFDSVMNGLLTEYSKEVKRDIESEVKSMGKEARTDVKDASPVLTGSYRAGWTTSFSKKNDLANFIVKNKTDWQLTHLIERGSRIVTKWGDTGRKRPAKPHIEPVQEKYNAIAVERIKKAIK